MESKIPDVSGLIINTAEKFSDVSSVGANTAFNLKIREV